MRGGERVGSGSLVGIAATIGAISLLTISLTGATPPERESDRPVTALVLSGGGARGAAHVGVLEVLEELHVPVDMIIGASMGAIVGGGYASGLSPESMRTRFLQIDWENAFSDQPPRRDIPFRRKEEDSWPFFQLEFGFGPQGFSFPGGFVAGQKLNFILRAMLLHAAKPGSFDDLPIPYRAIAVDLESGEAVVLDHGDLAQAIRASMSFPLAFTPVEIDGRLLVDGGVLKNMPVDVAFAMGAERVIAVDVGTPMGELKEPPTATGVLRRTSTIMSKVHRERQLELIRDEDILIVPDLEGIRTFEGFDKIDEAITKGRDAARGAADRLRELSVADAEWEAYLARQRAGAQLGDLTIDRIEVTGVGRVSPKLVSSRIKTRPGQPLDLDLLFEDLKRVYLIGEFEQVVFRIEENPTGQTVLTIDAEEKSWGPWYIRVGLALEANFEGSARFAVTGLLRRPHINRLGAEWRTFVSFGDFGHLDTELYQPVEYSGHFFVAPRLFYIRSGEEAFYVEDTEVIFDMDRGFVQLDLGTRFGHWGELRLGYIRGRVEAEPRGLLAGTIGTIERDLGAAAGRFVFDRLDNANFPRQGTYLRLSGVYSREDLGADDEYQWALLTANRAWPLGRRGAFLGTAEAGSSMGSSLPFYDDFNLGGFTRLSGSPNKRYLGDDLAFARIIPYWKVGEMGSLLGGDLYLGASLEAGATWFRDENLDLEDFRIAGSVFAGLDTLFGPIYVAYGYTEGGDSSLYFFLGRLFQAERLF